MPWCSKCARTGSGRCKRTSSIPERRIVDPHHHFFAPGGDFSRAYDLAALRADTAPARRTADRVSAVLGRLIATTARKRCASSARRSPSTQSRTRRARIRMRCRSAGIIGTVEMRLGEDVRPILDAHRAASPLFRGIRHVARRGMWTTRSCRLPDVADAALYADPGFRTAARILADSGLVPRHVPLSSPAAGARRARACRCRSCRSCSIISAHRSASASVCRPPERDLPGLGQRDLEEGLAACPERHDEARRACDALDRIRLRRRVDGRRRPTRSSAIRARTTSARFELFGPDRCMFESNFPRRTSARCPYTVLWNAFKKMTAAYSESEKDAMFAGTATRVYGLEP